PSASSNRLLQVVRPSAISHSGGPLAFQGRRGRAVPALPRTSRSLQAASDRQRPAGRGAAAAAAAFAGGPGVYSGSTADPCSGWLAAQILARAGRRAAV